jgi:hypothetical protein
MKKNVFEKKTKTETIRSKARLYKQYSKIYYLPAFTSRAISIESLLCLTDQDKHKILNSELTTKLKHHNCINKLLPVAKIHELIAYFIFQKYKKHLFFVEPANLDWYYNATYLIDPVFHDELFHEQRNLQGDVIGKTIPHYHEIVPFSKTFFGIDNSKLAQETTNELFEQRKVQLWGMENTKLELKEKNKGINTRIESIKAKLISLVKKKLVIDIKRQGIQVTIKKEKEKMLVKLAVSTIPREEYNCLLQKISNVSFKTLDGIKTLPSLKTSEIDYKSLFEVKDAASFIKEFTGNFNEGNYVSKLKEVFDSYFKFHKISFKIIFTVTEIRRILSEAIIFESDEFKPLLLDMLEKIYRQPLKIPSEHLLEESLFRFSKHQIFFNNLTAQLTTEQELKAVLNDTQFEHRLSAELLRRMFFLDKTCRNFFLLDKYYSNPFSFCDLQKIIFMIIYQTKDFTTFEAEKHMLCASAEQLLTERSLSVFALAKEKKKPVNRYFSHYGKCQKIWTDILKNFCHSKRTPLIKEILLSFVPCKEVLNDLSIENIPMLVELIIDILCVITTNFRGKNIAYSILNLILKIKLQSLNENLKQIRQIVDVLHNPLLGKEDKKQITSFFRSLVKCPIEAMYAGASFFLTDLEEGERMIQNLDQSAKDSLSTFLQSYSQV